LNITKKQMIELLEDEFEVYLEPNSKPALKLIRLLKSMFKLNPKDAKGFAVSGGRIAEYISLVDSKSLVSKLENVGGICQINQTGKDYLKQYDESLVEKYLSSNESSIGISEYYTTSSGGVLYDSAGTTYAWLIEDNNLSRACKRYLIEKAQIKF